MNPFNVSVPALAFFGSGVCKMMASVTLVASHHFFKADSVVYPYTTLGFSITLGAAKLSRDVRQKSLCHTGPIRRLTYIDLAGLN